MTNERASTARSQIAFRSYFAIAIVFFVGGIAATLYEPMRVPGFVFFGLGCLFIGFAVDARSPRAKAATDASDGGAAAATGDHDGGDGGGAGGGD